MQQHTPGPWFANDLSQRVHTEDDVTVARCEPHSTDMAKANARLISAAPDGLALAELAVQLIDPAALVEHEHPQAALKPLLLAAIDLVAKATGAA